MSYGIALLSFYMAFFAASGVKVEYHDMTSFDAERELLRSEIKLAGKPDLYIVIDLNEMKIYLKARSVVLREFAVSGMRYWGNPVSMKSHTLVNISSLFKPSREKIDPDSDKDEKEKSDKFRIKALELDDMPENYRLFLDENITLYINSASHGITSSIYNMGGLILWHISRPIETVWNKIRKRNHTIIRLTMDSQDARSLYWSLKTGTNILFISAPLNESGIDITSIVPSG